MLIGAPTAGALVKEAWRKEKVRRPVTLSESPLAEKPAEGEGVQTGHPATPNPDPSEGQDDNQGPDPATTLNMRVGYGAAPASAAGSALATPPT